MAEERRGLRVSVEEAKRRVDAGEGVLLDVVDTHVYRRLEHRAAGAVRMDPEEVPREYQRLARDEAVFAY